MPAGCKNTTHTAHVDNATQTGALHSGYLTGSGGSARILTMKKHVKTHVHALAPQCHTTHGGTPTFGQQQQWKITRSGDYLTNTWLRAEISSVTSAAPDGLFLRWTHNLGHNLIESLELQFSGVPACTFDEFYLDFFSAFSVPAGKRNMYDNMIGNIPELVNPIFDVSSGAAQVLPAAVLNVPLPMSYARDIGVSLPVGGLVYNDITVTVCLRDWDELLIASNPTVAAVDSVAPGYSRNVSRSDVVDEPTITALQLWSVYVVVATDERKRIGKVPRDMVWEIVQSASDSSVQTSTSSAQAYLRYSHAVKCLFFGMRNNTIRGQRSNYTTRQALCYIVNSGVMNLSSTEFPAPNAFDPIADVSLMYEGAPKLDEMDVDFFSMIQPYYYAYSAPTVTGYHVYSYASNFVGVDHAGSTDYGKLTNVSLEVTLSDDAQAALSGAAIAAGDLPFVNESGVASALPAGYLMHAGVATHLNGALSGAGVAVNQASGFNAQKQTFEVKNCSLAHSVVRFIGGGAGFPIF